MIPSRRQVPWTFTPFSARRNPRSTFDGLSSPPLIETLLRRNILTMDRSIPLPPRHSLAMSTTRSQNHGQNYERKRTRWLAVTTAVFALSGITGASARDIVYCSDVNTGSNGDASMFFMVFCVLGIVILTSCFRYFHISK